MYDYIRTLYLQLRSLSYNLWHTKYFVRNFFRLTYAQSAP
jgi:hypothetical protein